ncbi:glycoside hydrolase family 3 N-terminal domain-containing protein [Natranaeroarchaeum sulfidigenes]|uniref:beta-glucosidase n=1 Tax=Natranaeroarchaeum sulfidigenes TaxID=2784880 RepID=A0A897MSD4_9EURY|nr:glycoside hydrolase family 3 N-terminal domain-containing protein [Natranaeroarchaeum sulfidigenes]QSG03382.1 Bifunctional b-D-xylosidase/a-L-arabinosidase orrelated glycosidase [Natranaeroarchaeum sulfidigenes]
MNTNTQTRQNRTSIDIEEELDQLSLREKAGQLAGTYVGTMSETRTVEDVAELVREYGLGFATPFGYGASPIRDPIEAAETVNRLQRIAVEETSHGIPLAIPVDAIHGNAYLQQATILPHNAGLAATRNVELASEVGELTATEVAATGGKVTYGPTCDVALDPRWGRTFESFGESAYLCGEFAAAKARGVSTASEPVAAMAKHFPAYGDPSRGEDAAPVDRSVSSIRRDFLRAFEPVLDAEIDAVMPSYNSINGVPSHASSHFLRDVLRDELDFDGYVASDWNGVNMLHEHHGVSSDLRGSIRQSIEAGVDVHSLGEDDHVEQVVELVESGELDESLVDEAVRRILTLKDDLGLFEDPYVDVDQVATTLGCEEHQEISLEAARQSMTLLRNEDEVLPFSLDLDEVLVTGPNADELAHQVGGWSLKPDEGLEGETVLDGVESIVSDDTTVTYERGTGIRAEDDIEAAAAAASDADAAVVVLGENWYLHEFGPQDVTGPTDAFPKRSTLSLPSAQRELLETVVETGTPVALVIIAGRPLSIPWAAENVPAIIQAYYPGSAGGRAVAETVFGEVNPSGSLPVSVPRSTGHLPVRHNYLPGPTPIGADEHESSYDPLWPFGHGLSYTEFEYRSLETDSPTVSNDSTITVNVTIANTGDRAGATAVHVFASRPVSSVVTPAKQLVGFDRVELESGEERTTSLEVDAEQFSVVRPDGTSVLEPGRVELTCGEMARTLEIE